MVRINVSHSPYRITLFDNEEIILHTWVLEDIVQKAYEIGKRDGLHSSLPEPVYVKEAEEFIDKVLENVPK